MSLSLPRWLSWHRVSYVLSSRPSTSIWNSYQCSLIWTSFANFCLSRTGRSPNHLESRHLPYCKGISKFIKLFTDKNYKLISSNQFHIPPDIGQISKDYLHLRYGLHGDRIVEKCLLSKCLWCMNSKLSRGSGRFCVFGASTRQGRHFRTHLMLESSTPPRSGDALDWWTAKVRKLNLRGANERGKKEK